MDVHQTRDKNLAARLFRLDFPPSNIVSLKRGSIGKAWELCEDFSDNDPDSDALKLDCSGQRSPLKMP